MAVKGFINDNEIGGIPSVDFTEIDGATYLAPSAPAAGQLQLYPKNDGIFYTKNSAGTEAPLVTGAGFTPLSRAPVVAAALVDTTVAGPGATIDGFALTNGDRVLLTAQGTGSQNGLWVFNGAAVAMTRPSDYTSGSTFWATAGVQVLVLNGTANKWATWRLTTTGAITIDTTTTSWSPIGGLQVRGTTEQLRLGYDSTNYVSFTTGSSGNLTLTPTGAVVTISATGAIALPSGTTAQEPAGVAGMLRWNTTFTHAEIYLGSLWDLVSTSSDSIAYAVALG